MTGNEFRAIRKSLGLSLYRFGRALGYNSTRKTISAQVHKYETGSREIPPWIGRLAYTLYILHSEYGLTPKDLFGPDE